MDLTKTLENAMARQWLESMYLPFPLVISIIIISSLFSASWLFSLPLYQSLSLEVPVSGPSAVFIFHYSEAFQIVAVVCCSKLPSSVTELQCLWLSTFLSPFPACTASFCQSLNIFIFEFSHWPSYLLQLFVRICGYGITTFLSAAFLGNSWNKFLNLY